MCVNTAILNNWALLLLHNAAFAIFAFQSLYSLNSGTEEYNNGEDWFRSITKMAVFKQSEHSKIHSRWPYFNRDQYLEMTRQHLKKVINLKLMFPCCIIP